MTVALPLVLTLAYLGLLSLFPGWVERRPRWATAARSPIVLGLALGVYATSWTFYGSVGFADRYGLAFFAVCLGPTLACLAIPTLWQPLADLVRRLRFGSLADVLAHRFHSRAAGPLITLFMLAGLLPYLSLQLRAIADAASFLAGPEAPAGLGLVYAAILALFAAAVGVRYAEGHQDRSGLLAALALETTVKIVAILVVGVGALSAFGVDRLHERLDTNPEILARLWGGLEDGPWVALVAVAAVASFLLPRQFHVAFVERPEGTSLASMMWVFPAALLLLNLPLPLFYVIGDAVAPQVPPDRWVLAATEIPALRLLAFLGGVSASSAMVLVSTLALSGMVATHLILPLRGTRDLTREGSLRIRRGVVSGLVLAGFAFHSALPRRGTLVDLGLVSFVAVLQLLPGVLATLFWPRATARGLLWGLGGGVLSWALITALPFLGTEASTLPALVGLGATDPRAATVWISLTVNGILFVAGSLTRAPTAAEAAAAASCAEGSVDGAPESVDALRSRLATTLGEREAATAIERAAADLAIDPGERRPLPLARLRDAVEANLANLFGPLVARAAVGAGADAPTVADQLRFLDERARSPRSRPAVERSFEAVRRYLREVLAELPLGTFAVDPAGRLVVWNQALAELTGLPEAEVAGLALDELPDPWGPLLSTVEGDLVERSVASPEGQRQLRIRVAPLDAGRVGMVEDLTERRALRAQVVHQDRLASIGTLAAGVAHEVGNPLMGITMVVRGVMAEVGAEHGERLRLVLEEAERIDGIVRGMLGFSRREDPAERALVDLGVIARDAIRLVRLTGRRSVDVDLESAGEVIALGARQPLTQVVFNLLDNALAASPEGARVQVRAFARAADAVVEVRDSGPGIPSAVAERVFEPFFTTKGTGEGTGLGLAIAHGIARDHGGELSFEPVAEGGTLFRLVVPRSDEGER